MANEKKNVSSNYYSKFWHFVNGKTKRRKTKTKRKDGGVRFSWLEIKIVFSLSQGIISLFYLFHSAIFLSVTNLYALFQPDACQPYLNEAAVLLTSIERQR